MKCPSLLLIFGVLLPSFYLHCEAFKYRDSHHNGKSLLEAENMIDEVRHHRYRREVRLINNTDCQNSSNSLLCNDTTTKEDHKYYVSEIVKDGQKYWIDVQGNKNSKLHPTLSDSYLVRQTHKLSFQFPYYGHLLNEVMLTTGGFLYMDVHNTRLITEVQYLAPLMAYFNPQLSNDSKVYTLDDGSKLTVEWHNVKLHENATGKPFTFQCTLHKNGTIWFAYKQIPVKVQDIPPLQYHPVKVGIADAFVIRRLDPRRNILYRFFYIYSIINITKDSVVNNAAVIFHPLLSCVSAQTCTECINRTTQTNFSCEWCTKTERCSDGADRHRQEWEENECRENSIKEQRSQCVALSTTSHTYTTKGSSRRTGTSTFGPKKEERKTEEKKGLGGGAIFGIVLLLVLVIGIAAWCVYAYRHPTSKSGLFFIEATHRPREFFRRSPGTSGTTADPSDVKPQVL